MSVPASALSPAIDTEYTLDHKYTRREGRIYLSGVQALVRLPLMQQMRDRAANLNTAGFISGYRGSPLGGFDLELWKAKQHLKSSNIEFIPGLNEDLGATMVWGTQQTNLFEGAKYDGVFSMWYGKGPGVDRCGDVFKHGNAAGTSKFGGVLALAADDHACRSSTLPHGSELEFVSAMMPILNPAGVQDILDMGMLGWAMSRFTGRWVGFKTIAETVESSASVNVNPHQLDILMPEDFILPEGGLNIRWPDPPLNQEMRLHQYAVQAATAFARVNRIDRIVLDSPKARLGIVTTGKSYLDVLQALEYLGIDAKDAREIGIRVYKIGMTWPLEPIGIREFADGLEDVIVVEEKRSFIESQMKEYMYNWTTRPSVVGKYDEEGNWVLPSTNELTPAMIALVIAKRLSRFFSSEAIRSRVAWIQAKEQELTLPRANFPRAAHYCSGCPHNTSTAVPEGSRAHGGIGCHYMVTWMDRSTDTFSHMGGEGATWCGQAPFTETKHIFQNLGDGTYFHSGSLAIRQAIAAKVNITYKILYNDAVAMTGGQPVDGTLTVPDIAHQMRAEGVQAIVVVSDDIEKWSRPEIFPAGVEFVHRDELDALQKRMREIPGTSVLIYDQTCATEKRRRRKRGKLEDPKKRVFINTLACEGCGDCGEKSFCVSVLPKATEYGRKREIDQSGCNKDYSCVKGFCPSFVTVHGGGLKKTKKAASGEVDFGSLPMPTFAADFERPWNILVTGIGGTGVVTIGALIGMAAHLEGKGSTVLDQTGLAQKGGAVTCHLRIAKDPTDIHAVRIAAGEADLVLGCDMVVVNDYWALSKIRARRSNVVLNTYEAMPGTFTMKPDLQFPAQKIIDAVRTALEGDEPELIDATQLGTALLGDTIAANLFMLGYAWQKGWVPVSHESLMRAIELNGAAIEMNKTAFNWGRMGAHDVAVVRKAAGVGAAKLPSGAIPLNVPMHPAKLAQKDDAISTPQGAEALDDLTLSTSLDEQIARRVEFLTGYQNADYAAKYKALVDKVRGVEQQKTPAFTSLTQAVARYAFKLMAYKDEYEVARLYTSGDFEKKIRETFEGDYKIHFHLAPPLLAKKDADGHLRKSEYGPWVFKAFRVLAKLKGLRGGALDIFGYTAERKMERQLIVDYFKQVDELLAGLDGENHALAVDIASVPEHIRGYGHIKERFHAEAMKRQDDLLHAWRNPLLGRSAA
ncbi:MAG TPA: indolepyruvate ferredoxin oxidoreductase family protein [Dokdonella sp.]|uniref:indolepyruvate ferredoxin oxidoreductase family protein n=1 Tax=Dokdonella sp. TaxID=2291710 RepID=UPI002D808B91|nr:indolepyruvate ferredoxin oxidoreductase family protein [Dokdonella sp.]HET9033736.1 indolepyruvate ferredoxin oxidoreductase family protein [Dokdonella sp.]